MKKRYSAWILIVALMISSCGLDLGTENPQQKPGEGQMSENPAGSGDNSEVDDSESVDDSEKPEEPSTPGDSEDSDTENKYTYTDMNKTMWSKTSLNVRSEPSKIGEVIGYLATNEEVKVTGQCNETGWYRIEFKGKVGYASNNYLLEENPNQGTTPTDPEVNPDVTGTTMYATASVNVRSLPNTTGKVLGVLKTDESVVAIEEVENGWYKVLYNEKIGYVSGKYLTKEKLVIHPEITAEDIEIPSFNGTGPIIVIDAGHQEFTNAEQEPIGPGATTTKKKVSRGTKGCVSDWWEYELNLVVALKLRDELVSRGYNVVMIRESHAINISNSERAKVANNLNADAFIRIHANGSTNQKENGAFTMCQTSKNIYNGDKYASFRKLAECIIEGFATSTGCKNLNVIETDKMSGINWAQVPTTILEMGYMTNPTEDALMATEEYQDKMVEGIADGLDKFFQ